jgi:hypothetical protein
MQWYKDLLNDTVTLQDLSDHQLRQLRECWEYQRRLHPDEEIWDKARIEQERRKLEKATKAVIEARTKRKAKFSKEFF